MSLAELISILHPQDPYSGFDRGPYALDLQGWASDHPIFAKAIRTLNPALIIEVGSWKGASAIHMARSALAAGGSPTILCIDTWLGSPDHFTSPGTFGVVPTRHGWPILYYQFLANVLHCGCEKTIVPFPQTSINAAAILAHYQIQADLIYLDAAHDEFSVYQDIASYWPLLRPGGVMIGDDLIANYPGVRAALIRFMREHNLVAKSAGVKWLLEKPVTAG